MLVILKFSKKFVIRWVDHKLFWNVFLIFFFKADSAVRIRNFGKDIKDSIGYIHLIKQIAPEDAFVDKSALQTEGTSISFILVSYFYLDFILNGLGSRIRDMEAEWRLKFITDLISRIFRVHRETFNYNVSYKIRFVFEKVFSNTISHIKLRQNLNTIWIFKWLCQKVWINLA